MERHCSACGARISDDMKICGNCGKIIPPQRARNEVSRSPKQNVHRESGINSSYQRKSTNAKIIQNKVNKPKTQTERRKLKNAESIAVNMEVPQKVKNQKFSLKNSGKIKKWIKVAIVVIAIYIVISLVQIFRVRFTEYEFKSTDMKMSQKNFGQAIDNFFESGHWVYNPFTLTVKYTGETSEGNEYDMKFSAFMSIEIKEIEVDGKEKTDSQLESALMGMFI